MNMPRVSVLTILYSIKNSINTIANVRIIKMIQMNITLS